VSADDALVLAGRLAERGEPCVLATVVDVVRPASTRRGDRAVITADGALHGWIGGACSEPIVVREALRALADAEPRLVRIGPPGVSAEGRDLVVAESSCASEGVIDVLVEPRLPAPLLAVVGESPAARTLAELAATVGWRVSRELSADTAANAVVVATMGHGDEDMLALALAGGAGYIGLVASSRRASTVLATLRDRGAAEDALARVRSPAGLDLGPATQPEIAVAVLAELVAWRHQGSAATEIPAEATDPICGMTVAVEGAATAVHEGVPYYFCSSHCRAQFEADPARYAATVP
jgi:xanthine dehydrogenase accessory factor